MKKIFNGLLNLTLGALVIVPAFWLFVFLLDTFEQEIKVVSMIALFITVIFLGLFMIGLACFIIGDLILTELREKLAKGET